MDIPGQKAEKLAQITRDLKNNAVCRNISRSTLTADHSVSSVSCPLLAFAFLDQHTPGVGPSLNSRPLTRSPSARAALFLSLNLPFPSSAAAYPTDLARGACGGKKKIQATIRTSRSANARFGKPGSASRRKVEPRIRRRPSCLSRATVATGFCSNEYPTVRPNFS